ncbi:unnamed protein product, partial [Meganyctiphanes norvegica]
MPALRIPMLPMDEKNRHRRRLEALSTLGLHTAPTLALARPRKQAEYIFQNRELSTIRRGVGSRSKKSTAAGASGGSGDADVAGPSADTTSEATDDTQPQASARPMTTAELTRKIKKHQAAIKRDRRRFITGNSRVPARTKASYLQMLENRQEFRRSLVKLLKVSAAKTPEGRAKLERRYHYFITRGLSMRTSPLQESWVTNILNLVPKHLRKPMGTCQQLMQQLQQDYESKMRKVAVDFVLNSGKSRPKPVPEDQEGSSRVALESFNPSRNSIRRNLHLLNSCMLQTLELWYREYSALHLVKIGEVMGGSGALELSQFTDGVATQLDHAHQMLDMWFTQIQTIFYKGFQKGHMPGFSQPVRLASFCNTAVNIMTHNLQSLGLLSLLSVTSSLCGSHPHLTDPAAIALWADKPTSGRGGGETEDNWLKEVIEESLEGEEVLAPPPGSSGHPDKPMMIKLHLQLQGEQVVFSPTFAEVEKSLLTMYDQMIEMTLSVPRLETKLFAEWEGRQGNIKPVIEEHVVERLREQVLREIARTSLAPEHHQTHYDQYNDLIKGQAEEDIQVFMSEPHDFEEYVQKLDEFSELRKDILNSSTQLNYPLNLIYLVNCVIIFVVELGPYEVHCEQLVKALVERVAALNRSLMENLHHQYTEAANALCDELKDITERALSTPGDTLELMSHKAYMEDIMENQLQVLEERIWKLHSQLQFLAENMALSAEECADTVQPLSWFIRLPEVFRQHLQIITEKRAEYEAQLKERREKFQEELQDYAEQSEEFQDLGDVNELHEYLRRAKSLYARLDHAANYIDQINKEEEALQWNSTHYPIRKQVTDRLAPFLKLYEVGCEWSDKLEGWLHSPVGTHDPDAIAQEVAATWRVVYKLEKGFSDIPAAKNVVIAVRQRIEAFRENLPLVQTLGNPGLKERHWEKISEVVGYPLRADASTTLQRLIDSNLEDYLSKFETVSEAASKEHVFERNLEKMKVEWQEMELVLRPHRDSDTWVLSAVEDIQFLLDDHIVKTQSMRSSPFIKPIEVEVVAWETTLSQLQEVMDEWLRVQATWIYLEPIFGSPDIMAQMPEEGRRFNTVDKTWKDIMKSVRQNTRVLSVLEVDKILERLRKSSELLELIQRGLNEYLEKKRLYFPRFFFLSNEELLEILSETKDPSRVQPHLKKCFEGVNSLDFGEDLEVIAIRSSEQEVISLTTIISTSKARGQVEKWLVQLESSVKDSIKKVVSDSMAAYSESPREQWALEWPGQAVLAVSQTFWTTEVSNAMSEGVAAIKDYYALCVNQIDIIVSLVRGQLSKQNRTTLGALVVIDVHSRDVLKDELIKKEVVCEHDFTWLSQLRYYWADNILRVRMINTELVYGYEYLGNTGRLVITSLTDRCYRTLTQALHLNLGGAPEGPAGTGKTETTKDLAKAVAKQCIVFNCSDGMDYISLAKFFKGLASCGAWACFDEFNRIELEVLSVVAQQILTLQRGLQTASPRLTLHGTEICFNALCVKIYPHCIASTSLPETAAALFRSVAMMIPNYGLIAEISLYAFGFVAARDCARKIVATYRLCSEQLSAQPHYDYGMRTVKAVLIASGSLKLKYPDMLEAEVVLRSVRDVNLPKFLAHDLPLFQGIISDLFPGVVLPDPDYSALNTAIKEVCVADGLRANDYFLTKIQQVYETMRVRHGFMLIGNSFGGKTVALRTLAKALTIMNERGENEEEKVVTCVINPKAITVGQLYGQFDPGSHEWSDGVMAVYFRKFAVSLTPDRKWMILDGPVDSVWIENINSVLDDNKKLCLNSGEVICLANTTNLIFEVQDLERASPATVSRCGMVYMEPLALGWKPLVETWLAKLPKTLTQMHRGVLTALFHRFVPPLLNFVRLNLSWFKLERSESYIQKGVSPTTDLNLVRGLMNIFDCFLDEFLDPAYTKNNPESDIRAHLESMFLFSTIWSLGGPLDDAGRAKFDVLIRELIAGPPSDDTMAEYLLEEVPPPPHDYQLPIPDEDTVFHYKFVKERHKRKKVWSDKL